MSATKTAPNNETPSRRVRYAEAARHIGTPEGTLRSMVSRGQVPHIRLSKRLVVFDLAALDRWLADRAVHPIDR